MKTEHVPRAQGTVCQHVNQGGFPDDVVRKRDSDDLRRVGDGRVSVLVGNRRVIPGSEMPSNGQPAIEQMCSGGAQIERDVFSHCASPNKKAAIPTGPKTTMVSSPPNTAAPFFTGRLGIYI